MPSSSTRPRVGLIHRRALCRALWCGVVVALLVVGPRAPGQVAPAATGVTVPDSMEAAKDLETAYAMERQKDWAKAANWYQEVMNKYRAKVAPAGQDVDGVQRLYTSVALQVRKQMAKWPPEGVAAYRARYETTAAELLQQAGENDLGTLDQIFNTYFLTESAKTAALRMIDAHIERGEFDRAAEFGDILLDYYPAPNLEVERARLLYRTALAYHLCGDEPQALAHQAKLKSKYPDAVGTIFGKEVNLTKDLERALQVVPPLAAGLPPDSWPMPGGTPGHSDISQGGGRTGAIEYSIDMSQSSHHGGRGARNAEDEQDAGLDKSGATLGIEPVVDRGELFFQDGQRVYAVNLESGVPLPGWAQTYNSGNEHRGQYFAPASAAASRTDPHQIVLTDDCVLAIMGESNREMQIAVMQGMDTNGKVGTDGTKLVCLDRQTGKPRWSNPVSPASLPEENLRALDFCGSPLAVGDNVYVLGRGGKDFEFDNCYVFCFDLATGKYKWSCFVASCPIGNQFNGMGMGGWATESTIPQMAYSGGRLFVLSNVGALASVDAYTGTILWLSVYPHDPGPVMPGFNGVMINGGGRMMRGNGGNGGNGLRPWEVNPVFAADGRLFVLPNDSKYLMIYDAGTGSELEHIAVSELSPEGPLNASPEGTNVSLLAVFGDQLILSGTRWVLCLNWKQCDAAHPKEAITWSNGPWLWVQQDPLVRGRGFVTVDSVYVPTSVCLMRISMRDGRVLDRYPAAGLWDETQKEGPGNLLVTSEHVIVAGAHALNVYTDMDLARRKLDAEVAAAPGDPDPFLRYAEIMFGAGNFSVTFDKLDAASQLLGGLQTMRPGSARERFFNDTLTWAEKLARDKSGPAIAPALKMYDLVAAAAYGDKQQMDYRMSRAKFAKSIRDSDDPQVGDKAAVALYQEILSNPSWRHVLRSQDEGPGQVQAGAVVEELVGEIISRDKSAYSAVEKQAATALATAQSRTPAPSVTDLLEVANIYPNSQVAPRAMLLAADVYEAGGNTGLATHVRAETYRKYANRSNDPAIIEAMARNYLKLAQGGREDAIGVALNRLEKAADSGDDALANAKLTKPLTLLDGTVLDTNQTLAQAHDALAALVKKQEQAFTTSLDFRIPPKPSDAERKSGKPLPPTFLPAADVPVIPGVAGLVVPPADQLKAQRTDRLVALLENNALAIYVPGQAQPLATVSPLTDAARGLVWMEGSAARAIDTRAIDTGLANVFVAWAGHELAAVQADTGTILWRAQLPGIPSIEVVTTTGSQGELAEAEANADNDIDVPEVRVSPQVRNMNRMRVQQMIMAQRMGMGMGIVNMNGVPAVVAAPIAPAGEEQVWQVCPAGERVLCATSTGRLICLDAASGKFLWQTRLTDHPVDRLLANEDFSVLKITRGDGSVDLAVIDNYDGQIQSLKKFSVDNVLVPVNVALSDDGLLAWTLPDRLMVRDLYEPGEAAMDSSGGKIDPNSFDPNRNRQLPFIFAGMILPQQLVFAGNKILTIQTGGRYLTVHPLADLRRTLGKKVDAPETIPLNTAAPDPAQSTVLRVRGSWAYCVGVKSLEAYNLDRPGDIHWRGDQLEGSPNVRDAFVDKTCIVLLDEPASHKQLPKVPKPIYRLHIFTGQGYYLDKQDTIDSAGILQWQCVDGGFCYVSADHKLHSLRGGRP